MAKNNNHLIVPNKTLYELVQSKETLQLAWQELNKPNPVSHGLSGVTMAEFKENLEIELDEIESQLKANQYSFSPTRAVLIPKDDGKFRPLQIPEIKDRIVLKALALILENELQPILKESKDVSFAYQKGKGRKEAIESMKEKHNAGKTVILKADIVSFFDEIDKNLLLTSKIFPELAQDTSINNLITQALSQELKGLEKIHKDNHKYFKDLDKGIPQGNPLSPFLSNIYLASFDQAMKEKGYDLIRYADDFLVMCKTKEEAQEAFNFANEYLEHNLNLKLYPIGDDSKSKIIEPTKEKISFLGIVYDGKSVLVKRKKITALKEKISHIGHKYQKSENLDKNLKFVLNTWLSLYEFADIKINFQEIDQHVKKQLDKANKITKRDVPLKVPMCHTLFDVRKKNSAQRKSKNKIGLIDRILKFLKIKK